jgi:hypothetical protein
MCNSDEPTLDDFFVAYMAWIDDGAPETHKHFTRMCGLCGNLESWARYKSNFEYLCNELTSRFQQSELDVNYPFCASDEYDEMWSNNTQHTFEPRLKWVREQIAMRKERV